MFLLYIQYVFKKKKKQLKAKSSFLCDRNSTLQLATLGKVHKELTNLTGRSLEQR